MPQHHVMVMVMCIVSHDQKSHFAPHFDCLDQRNSMVPLMMPSASHDTNVMSLVFHDKKLMLLLIVIIILT